MIARPSKHFAKPPYKAELFNSVSGWAGVMNRDGVNCLVWTDDGQPTGKTVTDIETAKALAEEWNKA